MRVACLLTWLAATAMAAPLQLSWGTYTNTSQWQLRWAAAAHVGQESGRSVRLELVGADDIADAADVELDFDPHVFAERTGKVRLVGLQTFAPATEYITDEGRARRGILLNVRSGVALEESDPLGAASIEWVVASWPRVVFNFARGAITDGYGWRAEVETPRSVDPCELRWDAAHGLFGTVFDDGTLKASTTDRHRNVRPTTTPVNVSIDPFAMGVRVSNANLLPDRGCAELRLHSLRVPICEGAQVRPSQGAFAPQATVDPALLVHGDCVVVGVLQPDNVGLTVMARAADRCALVAVSSQLPLLDTSRVDLIVVALLVLVATAEAALFPAHVARRVAVAAVCVLAGGWLLASGALMHSLSHVLWTYTGTPINELVVTSMVLSWACLARLFPRYPWAGACLAQELAMLMLLRNGQLNIVSVLMLVLAGWHLVAMSRLLMTASWRWAALAAVLWVPGALTITTAVIQPIEALQPAQALGAVAAVLVWYLAIGVMTAVKLPWAAPATTNQVGTDIQSMAITTTDYVSWYIPLVGFQYVSEFTNIDDAAVIVAMAAGLGGLVVFAKHTLLTATEYSILNKIVASIQAIFPPVVAGGVVKVIFDIVFQTPDPIVLGSVAAIIVLLVVHLRAQLVG
jgi:hypothetical protein